MTLRSEFDTMQLTEKASFRKTSVKFRVSNYYFCSRKRHVETPEERGNEPSQKVRPSTTLRVTICTLPNLPLS